MGRFPKTKVSFLEAFGDVAVDFDFAPPELQPGEQFVEKSLKTVDSENTISEKLEDLSITYSNLCKFFF